MKVLTNPFHPIMERSYALIFDLEVFDPKSNEPTPECDAIICQGIPSLGAWLERINKDYIIFQREKPRLILTHYENPYPFSNDRGVLAGLAKHADVTNVVVLNEHQQEMWGKVGTVIYPTLDFDAIPEWTGESEEPFIFSYSSNGMQMDWSRGFGFATQVGIKPLRTHIDTSLGIDLGDERFTKCRMYLNTSLCDAMPWGFAIAMAAGCPIVTTNTYFTKKAFSVPGSYFGFVHNTAHGIRTTLLDAVNTADFVAEFKERGMDKKLRSRARDLMSQDRFRALWYKVLED